MTTRSRIKSPTLLRNACFYSGHRFFLVDERSKFVTLPVMSLHHVSSLRGLCNYRILDRNTFFFRFYVISRKLNICHDKDFFGVSSKGILRKAFGIMPQITDFGGFKREKVFNSYEKARIVLLFVSPFIHQVLHTGHGSR